MKWVNKYLEAGYEYICMGGVAKTKGYTPYGKFYEWGERVWRLLCPTSNQHKPIVKVHGFAITSIPLMQRYPWYSVDSVTWKKMSYYGQILVPKGRRVFNFRESPNVVFMDSESKYTKRKGNTGRHFLSYSKSEQAGLRKWLDFIEVPFGERAGDGSIITLGVTNDSSMRCSANIRFFEVLAKSLPKWPWAFQAEEPGLFFDPSTL